MPFSFKEEVMATLVSHCLLYLQELPEPPMRNSAGVHRHSQHPKCPTCLGCTKRWALLGSTAYFLCPKGGTGSLTHFAYLPSQQPFKIEINIPGRLRLREKLHGEVTAGPHGVFHHITLPITVIPCQEFPATEASSESFGRNECAHPDIPSARIHYHPHTDCGLTAPTYQWPTVPSGASHRDHTIAQGLQLHPTFSLS